MKTQSKLAPLWKEEDWWAVWFAFIIILAVIIGVVHRVPKIGKWEDNPLTIFNLKRNAVTKLRVSDLKDPTKLIVSLQDQQDPLVARIRSEFTTEELQDLDRIKDETVVTETEFKRISDPNLTGELISTVVKRLNDVIRGRSIYDFAYFSSGNYKLNDKIISLLPGSSAFNLDEIIDSRKLAVKLRSNTDTFTVFLSDYFSSKMKMLLDAYNGTSETSDTLNREIVTEFNRIIIQQGILDPLPATMKQIPQEILDSIKASGSEFAYIHINRQILQNAYPNEIKSCRLPLKDPSGTDLIQLNRMLLETRFPDSMGVGKRNIIIPLIMLMIGLGILTFIGIAVMKGDVKRYLAGFIVVFLLALISYAISHQVQISKYGLSYAFWALIIGLLISNTIGTPKWLLAGAKTEMYIKTGLVLLGAEIIFSKILQLGGPGLFVAWLVTPTVIFFMFWFGTKVLKLASKSLVMIIAAATSVCGVSAAIAVAAASKAKKEELTLGVGMTLIFTVLMMVTMPILIKWMGMNPIIGGAWMGGTIDSTGAVVAAGSMLGPNAEKVAAVVKMIQNILIGIVAFCVAVYWVTRVERQEGGARPSAMEIWYRMPKFIVGFVAASVIFSFVLIPLMGKIAVDVDIIKDVTSNTRGWFFCLAFVAIGLESNFRDLASQLVGGKPIWLYITGQSFNLVLTLLAAWLAFGGIIFKAVCN